MKKLIVICMIMGAAAMLISCGTDQVKATGPDKVFVTTSNEQLAKYPIGGFAYKSSVLPPQSWAQWAKVAAPVVREILNKMPKGYALEVRGHTDGTGPEYPEGNKPGNLKISEDRAKAVYAALKGAGISSPNLTYKGVGSQQLIQGLDRSHPRHRRVTFVIVPK